MYTRNFLSGGFYHEGTVFPGDFADNRITAHLSILHSSTNGKFNASVSASFSSDKNVLPIVDLTSYITLPSVAPVIYDSLGKLNWEESTWTNPFSFLYQKYTSNT